MHFSICGIDQNSEWEQQVITAHWLCFYWVIYKRHCNTTQGFFFSRSFHCSLVERQVEMFWPVPHAHAYGFNSLTIHIHTWEMYSLSSPCRESHLPTLSTFLRRKSWTSVRRAMTKENKSNLPWWVGSTLAQLKSFECWEYLPLLHFAKWALSAVSRSIQCTLVATWHFSHS